MAVDPVTLRRTLMPHRSNGNVGVDIGQFLVVNLNLTYRPRRPVEPTPIAESASTTGDSATNEKPRAQVFRLEEKRRIKLEELHYFDHPAFGVLLKVEKRPEPVVEPQPAPEIPPAPVDLTTPGTAPGSTTPPN